MECRHRIRELVYLVESGLQSYVQVHNYIQSESATAKSMFKNLIGRGVSNEQLLKNAEALVPVWTDIRTSVTAFEHSSASTMTSHESHYLSILSRYVDALDLTVQVLVERQRLLLERKMNPSDVTLGVFKEVERRYEDRCNDYVALGQELNNLAPLIFD